MNNNDSGLSEQFLVEGGELADVLRRQMKILNELGRKLPFQKTTEDICREAIEILKEEFPTAVLYMHGHAVPADEAMPRINLPVHYSDEKHPYASLVLEMNAWLGGDKDHLAFLRLVTDKIAAEIFRVESCQKIVEAHLEAEERLHGLFMQTPALVAILQGKDSVCTFVNSLARKLFNNRDLLNRPIREALPEFKDQGLFEPLDYVLETGKPFVAHEYPAKADWKDDGQITEAFFNLAVTPYYDSEGNIAGLMTMGYDVTEQVLSKRKIAESELRYRQLIEGLPVAMYTCDEQGYVRLYNKAAVELWGREPVIGQDIWCGSLRAFRPDGTPVALEDCPMGIAVREARKVPGKEVIIERPDGSLRHIMPYPQPIINAAGEVTGAVNVVDITEQKTTEMALKATEERFRNMVTNAPVGIAVLRGFDFLVEVSNETYLQIVDKAESEFLGKKMFEVLPELEGQGIHEMLTSVMKTGIPHFGTEFKILMQRHGEKEITYFNFVYQPLFETNGEVSGVVVVANEVTRMVEAKHKLAESEQQFRNMVMNSSIAMSVFKGPEWVVELANEAMVSIWGKSPHEVLNRKLLEVLPELSTQKFPDLLRKVYNTGVAYKENEAEVYLKEKNNKLRKFYLDFEYAPLFEEGGQVSGIMVTANNVTERVEARKKIEESEAYFRRMSDNVPTMIFMTRSDGYTTYKNRQWCEYTGKTIEEAQGYAWLDVMLPEDRENAERKFMEALHAQAPFSLEFRLRNKDGEYRWFVKTGTPRFSQDGVFEGYIGTLTDSHERKMAEEKIKDAEERSRIAINTAELGTYDWDMATGELICSLRYFEIFGYKSPQNLKRDQLLTQVYPEDRHILEEAHKKSHQTGILEYEMRIVRADNELRWIKAKGKVFFDDDCRPVRLLGTVMDITEQRNALKALEERELLFKTISNTSPVGLWLADTKGDCTYVNDTWAAWTGLKSTDNLQSGWLKQVIDADKFIVKNKFMEALVDHSYFACEFRLKRSDGSIRWCVSEGFPYHNVQGEFAGYAGSVTDITDKKMAQAELENKVIERTRELKEANVLLEKSNQELEQFAYVSSHDLQEPLRKIQTFSELLKHNRKSENFDKYLAKIHSASQRMSTLIRDLLNYSRLSNTKDVFVNVDLNEILKNILMDFELMIEQKSAMVEHDSLPVVKGIPLQLNQLFSNLISNSLKFTDKKPLLRISCEKASVEEVKTLVKLDPKQEYIKLSFSDNGIGFDPQYAAQIFVIFQRLNDRQTYEGTGIGLALCKKIVENHGGTITATGAPGEGATFKVYLPAIS